MPDASHADEPVGLLAGLAIFMRVVWLPAWAGLALGWLGIPAPVAVIASTPLLIAEVLSFRRRWTRRMLRGVVPADPAIAPGDGERDVRWIARAYGVAFAGFLVTVAIWLALVGVTLDRGLGFGWISYGIAIAAAAYVGFEYLARSRHGTRFRAIVLTRNNIRAAGDQALVFVLPRSWQLGASALVGTASCLFMSLLAMVIASASDWEQGPLDPTGVGLAIGMIAMFQAAGALFWAMLEAGLVAPIIDDEEMQRRLDLVEQARQK